MRNVVEAGGDLLSAPRQFVNSPLAYTTSMEHSPTSATGIGWQRTAWQATQRAAWEALKKAETC